MTLDALKRNKELAPVAHASQWTSMLVLRAQIDWRSVKYIIAPYLRNNAGWRETTLLKG